MAITFVAASTGNTALDSLNVALPTGWAAGDLLLMFAEDAGATLSASAGWTPLACSPQATTGSSTLWGWYRVAQAGDGAANISGTSIAHLQAGMVAYRGVDNTTPLDVTPVGGVENTSDTTGATGASVTTVSAGCMIVVAFSHATDSVLANYSSWANSNLVSVDERIDAATTITDGGGIGVADGIKTTAGAVGSTTTTYRAASVKGFMTIPLRPDTGGGGPTTYDSCGVLVAF